MCKSTDTLPPDALLSDEQMMVLLNDLWNRTGSENTLDVENAISYAASKHTWQYRDAEVARLKVLVDWAQDPDDGMLARARERDAARAERDALVIAMQHIANALQGDNHPVLVLMRKWALRAIAAAGKDE